MSSQRWDSHIHDGYKRPVKVSDNYKMTWDGSKNSRIADELEKSCNRAYGGQGKYSRSVSKCKICKEYQFNIKSTFLSLSGQT